MDVVLDEERLKIKFEGQTHQINVNTLTSSLLILSETLKDINTELNTGKNVEIRIEALTPGSFVVQAVVAAINSNDLLTAISTVGGVSAATTGTLVGTYKGIIGLRKWLSKRKSDEIESISEDTNGTVIKALNGDTYIASNVVYNIYSTSQSINDKISDQFQALEEDPAIEGLTLITEEDSVSVEKDDFSPLARKVDVSSENRKKELKANQTLSIVKPVLEKSNTRRWEFIWNGNRISANITDMDFLEKVEQGELRFGTGDYLTADLQINQVLNPVYNAWINETYQINKVGEHTPRTRSVTTKMDL